MKLVLNEVLGWDDIHDLLRVPVYFKTETIRPKRGDSGKGETIGKRGRS